MSNEVVIKEYVVRSAEKEIYGKLYRPAGEGKYPAVIISHGYNGCHAHWERECVFFASNGYVAYAYDFCGGSRESKSSGKSTDMTIFNEKDELLAVFEEIAKLEEVDSEQIYLFGQSQGGLVTALAAEEIGDRSRGVVLYYPALNIPDDWRRNYATEDAIPEITDLWGLMLSKKFFMEIRDFHTFEHIGNYVNRVLILHGDMDNIVPLKYSQKAVAMYPNAQLMVMEGEGHGFQPKSAQEAMERVVQFMSE